MFRGRVGGMLAITRALGDKSLGESVSHVPDVAVVPFVEVVDEKMLSEGEGDDETEKVFVKKVEGDKDENDTLIIACDGLWDYVE